MEVIRELAPSARVSGGHVFEALRGAGFGICNCPGSAGVAFRWMFREKEILVR